MLIKIGGINECKGNDEFNGKRFVTEWHRVSKTSVWG